VGMLAAWPAQGASMVKVDQATWQQGVTGLPTYVNMYIWVPDTLATKPPIVVVPHHCGGTASSTDSENSSLYSVASKTGFIIIIPEATGQNCWDAGSIRSMKHGGGGDTGAIVQMVKYTIGKYSADANRVYTTGSSSGAIMTEALLGVYPDVFMAGVSFMGVPCGCWADGYNDVTGKPSNGTGQWSGNCAGGKTTKTAQQWGDLVRSYFPGYTGHRPRLQHWHGTADTTLDYKNMAEDIKEWTNVLGLTETPTSTEANTPKSGTTHQAWKNSCYTVYETFSEAGVGHAIVVDGAVASAYFGIDKASTQDPETAACPGAVPGGGSSGAGGATATGGAIATGGAMGTGGAGGARDAGSDGRDGGLSSSGGILATGGSTPKGGNLATGGNPGNGGTASQGGLSVTGGRESTGGVTSTGGNPSTGGSATTGGNGVTGGRLASGGASAQGGSSATGGSVPNPTNGCSCALGKHGERDQPGLAVLLLTGFGVLVGRRRPRR